MSSLVHPQAGLRIVRADPAEVDRLRALHQMPRGQHTRRPWLKNQAASMNTGNEAVAVLTPTGLRCLRQSIRGTPARTRLPARWCWASASCRCSPTVRGEVRRIELSRPAGWPCISRRPPPCPLRPLHPPPPRHPVGGARCAVGGSAEQSESGFMPKPIRLERIRWMRGARARSRGAGSENQAGSRNRHPVTGSSWTQTPAIGQADGPLDASRLRRVQPGRKG